MIARIIQWLRQGGRRYPQNTSPFGGTLGNNVGGIVPAIVPSTVGMEFLSLLSPARVTLSTYSPVRASVELLSLVDATAEGDSQS